VGLKLCRKFRGIDLAGHQFTARYFFREFARGLHDFLLGAVIESDHERRTGIIFGDLLGFVQQTENVGLQPFALADHSHAHIVLVQLREIVSHEALQEPHEIVDLVCRTRPVLGAEAIDREIFDSEFAGRRDDVAKRFDTAAMTFAARQPACRRPATVAVHDDRDMHRRRVDAGGLVQRGVWHGHDAYSRQTDRISFSLCASI
jgi:hypothetical protein